MAAEGRALRKAFSNWSGRFCRCFAGAGPGPIVSSSSCCCPLPTEVVEAAPLKRLLSSSPPPPSVVVAVMVELAVVSLGDAMASSRSARVLGENARAGRPRERGGVTRGA
jgi:hypothetical protein